MKFIKSKNKINNLIKESNWITNAFTDSLIEEENKETIQSTLFWTQENRPYGHFTFLVKGIEETFHSGRPAWPIERTLLTTGMLDALLRSKAQGGKPIETPHLNIPYKSEWSWEKPPPPPKERPWNKQ